MYNKITEADLDNKGVVGLADTPGLSTSEMQRKFDEIALDVIVPKVNEIVDELNKGGNTVKSEKITDIRLSSDKNLQVSYDEGETWQESASSGHIIMTGAGQEMPIRPRLQFSANTVVSDNAELNSTFVSIPSGPKGDKGESATIRVGTVEGAEQAYVQNVGSDFDAIFNFGIPKGDPGDSATIQVGTVQEGDFASVSNRGTSENAILDFVLPKGPKGDPGTSLIINATYPTYADLIAAHPIGVRGDTYAVGDNVSNDIYVWDVDSQKWSNLGSLKGAKGDTGDAATVNVGVVTQGTRTAVENVGTPKNAIFNFTLEKGAKGDTGEAATIAIGSVTTGETASVINSGTTTNAVLDFVVPKGEKGEKGNPTIVNNKSGEAIILTGNDIFLPDYRKAEQEEPILTSDSVSVALGKLEKKVGSSKLVHIKVVYGGSSVGKTITLTCGEETYSFTADSTREKVVDVVSLGTWTVTDGEIEVSIDVEFYGNYKVTLGGFGYQGWLDSIGITTQYSSLDDLLADEPTLRTLFTKHASVDYLCTGTEQDELIQTILANDYCAKWINLRDYALDTLYAKFPTTMDTLKKYGYGEWALIDGTWQPKGAVPIMTSNTAPYGEAICGYNSSTSGYEAYKAFNNDLTDFVDVHSGTMTDLANSWFAYKFTNPICPKKVGVALASGGPNYKGYKFNVEYSNDGTNWTSITSNDFDTTNADYNKMYHFDFDNEVYAIYWRVRYTTSKSSQKVTLSELQFYGRSLNVSVPKMTSNTAPWGEAIGSSSASGRDFYNAFDCVGGDTAWWSGNTPITNGYVGYNFGNDVLVKCVSFNIHSGNQCKDYSIDGSNDGTNWTTLYDGQNTNTGSNINVVIPISEQQTFKFYRINIKNTVSSARAGGIRFLQFFGLDYSEHAERKYIYDHGVEVLEVDTFGDVTKKSDSVVIKSTTASPYISRIGSKNLINLSTYKLARAKVINSTDVGYGYLVATSKMSEGSQTAYNLISDLPNNPYMDISSVNDNLLIALQTNRNGANSTSQELSELWVE